MAELEVSLSDRIPDFKKAARRVGLALKAVNAAEKALVRNPAHHLDVRSTAARAARDLGKVAGVDILASDLSRHYLLREKEAGAAMERDRALLAGQVAERLGEAAMEVTGNLPHLRAGAFTLEFDFADKGLCTVWFGPGKQKLLTCPLEPEAIAEKVLLAQDDLFHGDWDDEAFLADLESAYRVSLARLGLVEGESVPLTSLLAEVAFQRQDGRFFSDPRRELYSSFGRVEFAVALSRLANWQVGDRELRLDVATLAQTRRSQSHIWVPRGRGVEGVNYASARFVRMG